MVWSAAYALLVTIASGQALAVIVGHVVECLYGMVDVLNNYTYLSKVILEIQTEGNLFLRITSFGAAVKRFVDGVYPDNKVQESEVVVFRAEIESLLHLCPALEEGEAETFRKFHNFMVDCGHPLGSVLVS